MLQRDHGAGHVRQGSPRQLWDEVEQVFGLWQDLGEPTQERFGLTVIIPTIAWRHVARSSGARVSFEIYGLTT